MMHDWRVGANDRLPPHDYTVKYRNRPCPTCLYTQYPQMYKQQPFLVHNYDLQENWQLGETIVLYFYRQPKNSWNVKVCSFLKSPLFRHLYHVLNEFEPSNYWVCTDQTQHLLAEHCVEDYQWMFCRDISGPANFVIFCNIFWKGLL